MLKTLDIVLIAAMIGAAAVTYQIKHRAEDKLDQVQELQAKIKQEQETIDLLKADWALLNQPSRLERLNKDYADQLELETIEAVQMAKPQELPGFPAKPEEPLVSENPNQPDTGLKTGSVKAQ